MKKIILPAIAVVFTMFMLSSCGGSNVEEDIVGVWKIESADLSNLDELVTQMAEQFGVEGQDLEDMKAEMNDGMSDEFVSSTIEFKEDHSAVSPDGGDAEWSYDADDNKIVIKDGEDEFDFFIDKLSGDKLDCTLKISDSGMDFEIALSMTRQ